MKGEMGEHKMNIMGKKCKAPSCVDLFVFVAVIIAMVLCAFAIAENFVQEQKQKITLNINVNDYINKFYCIFNTCFFSVGCLLCLLLALPCYRESYFSAKFTRMFGVLLLALSVGYAVGALYAVYAESNSLSTFFPNLSSKLNNYFNTVSATTKVIKNFSICGLVINGVAMFLLSIWLEYKLTYKAKLTGCYICSSLMFNTIMSLSSILCFSLVFPLISPMKWFPAELFFQPRLISIAIRLASSLTILFCLLPLFSKSKLSTFFFIICLMGNIAMLVISAAKFSFSPTSQWAGYSGNDSGSASSHKELIVLWVLTTALVFLCFLLNWCCKPKIKFTNNSFSNNKIISRNNSFKNSYNDFHYRGNENDHDYIFADNNMLNNNHPQMLNADHNTRWV